MGYNICPAKKLKPNTSACKARLGCGLCGCAVRPAPYIVKHSRATPHTHTHTKGALAALAPTTVPMGAAAFGRHPHR